MKIHVSKKPLVEKHNVSTNDRYNAQFYYRAVFAVFLTTQINDPCN